MIETMSPILGLSVAQKQELGSIIEEEKSSENKDLEQELNEAQGLGSKFMSFLLQE